MGKNYDQAIIKRNIQMISIGKWSSSIELQTEFAKMIPLFTFQVGKGIKNPWYMSY